MKSVLRILLTFVLSAALFTPSSSLIGHAQESAQLEPTALVLKIKTEVIKCRDNGREIRLKLRNGQNVTGYVVQVGKNDFTIQETQTGSKQSIAYTEVAKASAKRKGISTLAKVGIAWMAVGTVLTLVYVAGGHGK